MKVLIIGMGQDTAGQGIRIREGFARLRPSDTVRTMFSTRTYIKYPVDIPWNRRTAEKLWAESDLVHLRNNFDTWASFGRRDRKRKPNVLHHHGTHYRENYERLTRLARNLGTVEIASTVDLLFGGDHITWVPAPYNLDSLRMLRSTAYEPGGPIRIAHAPTDRAIKDTEAVIAAVEALKQRRPDIEFDLIERVTWRECLERKAKADIFIDQFQLGYGCNAVEAWAMGMPVVAGTTNPETKARMLSLWGELPFVEATVGDLVDVLDSLVQSEEQRQVAAKRGAEHVERYHADEKVVPLLADIYERAMGG